MIKIAVIFGTRPECIKLYPVIRELKKVEEFKVITVSTGQHQELLDPMLKTFKIKPDYKLNVMSPSQSLSILTANLHEQLGELFTQIKPELVIVQGDTTTALVASLEAYYHKIPVAHVEAGLRTDDIYSPFPEELNRRIISLISLYNFAPTQQAFENLTDTAAYNYKTGNTGIDTVMEFADKCEVEPKKQVLVTLHRRESFGLDMKSILEGIRQFVIQNPDFTVLFPVHLNPNVQKLVKEILGNQPRINLCKPLSYEEMIKAMKESYFIMTDSGGIQEEAPSLFKPVLVLRRTTERPEGVEEGVARLVGTDSEEITRQATLLAKYSLKYKQMQKVFNPYGDGMASQRIAEYLEQELC